MGRPMRKAYNHAPETPSLQTLSLIRKAVEWMADGKTLADAATSLGLKRHYFWHLRSRYPHAFDEEFAALTGERLERAQTARRGLPPEAIRERIRQAVKLIAGGQSAVEAAKSIGTAPRVLYHYKEHYPVFWNAEHDSARQEFAALGLEARSRLNPATLSSIQDATALIAAGLTLQETADRLNVKLGTVRYWKSDHAETWTRELDRAMRTTLIVIRRQAGTDAVMDDPESYLCRALACERWARRTGQELFPPSDRPTLSSFFESHYLPSRLHDASPKTIETFRAILLRWKLLTGDPPLDEITIPALARFRDCLERTRGRSPVSRFSPQTVRSYFTHLECLLHKAGAADYRNRDGAGLIASIPWIKKPPAEAKPVRIVTAAELNALYLAAVAMDFPKIDGFKAPAWWRAPSCCGAEHGASPPDPFPDANGAHRVGKVPSRHAAQASEIGPTIPDSLDRHRPGTPSEDQDGPGTRFPLDALPETF